jgi:hypothetical protein
MAIIQFISLMMVACFNNYNPDAADKGASAVMWWTIIYSIGGAFMEVVC